MTKLFPIIIYYYDNIGDANEDQRKAAGDDDNDHRRYDNRPFYY